jgi:hypothetical protein
VAQGAQQGAEELEPPLSLASCSRVAVGKRRLLGNAAEHAKAPDGRGSEVVASLKVSTEAADRRRWLSWYGAGLRGLLVCPFRR